MYNTEVACSLIMLMYLHPCVANRP
uniref:Uncharacterized protein n=1 Tax=Anguilla anguilla TaxID=7936 RepID=A0A0E9R839_ANGAN